LDDSDLGKKLMLRAHLTRKTEVHRLTRPVGLIGAAIVNLLRTTGAARETQRPHPWPSSRLVKGAQISTRHRPPYRPPLAARPRADDDRSLSSSVPSTRTATGWLEIARGLSRMRANASAACARPGRSVGQRRLRSSAFTVDSTGPGSDDILATLRPDRSQHGRVRSGASAGHPWRRR
jgi:hypothetical protein